MHRIASKLILEYNFTVYVKLMVKRISYILDVDYGSLLCCTKYLTRNFFSEITGVGYLVIVSFHDTSVFSLLSFKLLDPLSLYILAALLLAYLCYLLFIVMFYLHVIFLDFPMELLGVK